MPFCYHSRPATDNNTYWNCDKPETLYTRLRSISKKAIRDCCKLMRWFTQCMTLHRANDAQTKWFISMSEICNEWGKSPERFWRLSAEISSMNGPFFDNAQKHAQWIESRLCGLWSNLSEWQINSGKPISNVVLIWTLNLYLLFNIIRQRGTHVFWCRTNSKQRTKSAALEKCACYEASESTNVYVWMCAKIILLFCSLPGKFQFFFFLYLFFVRSGKQHLLWLCYTTQCMISCACHEHKHRQRWQSLRLRTHVFVHRDWIHSANVRGAIRFQYA